MSVGTCLKCWTRLLRFHADVLVVDDGSTDGTGKLLARRRDIHLIRHPENRGYGQSLIDAFAYADGRGYDWVITMDCDEQHEPEMHSRFCQRHRDRSLGSDQRLAIFAAADSDDLPPGDRRAINATITEIVE